MWLTSRQETDDSAHLDKRSKEHHVSWNSRFDLHSLKVFDGCFRKQHGHEFRLLFEETRFHAGSDWISSPVIQKVARGQLSTIDMILHLGEHLLQFH